MAFGGLKGTLTINGNSVGASNALAGSVAVNALDLVFVIFGQQTNLTATTCTDNLGNTYTATNAGTDAGTVTGRAYYSVVTNAGTITSVTVSASASTNDFAGIAAVIEGPFCDAAVVVDKNIANATGDLSSPFTCPATGTLGFPEEAILCWSASDGNATWSATSPNLKALQANNSTNIKVIIGYQAVSSTGTVSPEFTGTNPSVNLLGTTTFKQQIQGGITFGAAGSLSASAVVSEVAVAQLSGSGVVGVNGAQVEAAYSALIASGTLGAVALLTQDVAAAFHGSATMGAGGGAQQSARANLAGSGLIGADIKKGSRAKVTWAHGKGNQNPVVFTNGAALTGSGVMVARLSSLSQATAAFAGSGVMGASAAENETDGTAFAGVGSLSAVAGLLEPASAALIGSGLLAASAYKLTFTSTGLTGSGLLSAGALQIEAARASFSGEGTFGADAQVPGDHGLVVRLTGDGLLTADGLVQQFDAASLSGSGALSAETVLRIAGRAMFFGAGNLEANTTDILSARARLAASGSFVTDARRFVPAGAALSGTGHLQTHVTLETAAEAHFDGRGNLQIYAKRHRPSVHPVRKKLEAKSNVYDLRASKKTVHLSASVPTLKANQG